MKMFEGDRRRLWKVVEPFTHDGMHFSHGDTIIATIRELPRELRIDGKVKPVSVIDPEYSWRGMKGYVPTWSDEETQRLLANAMDTNPKVIGAWNENS